MEPQTTVFIHSKYSESCRKLLDIIQQCKVDFNFIQLLCIDNEDVRRRIKQNEKIKVEVVPCILSIYQGGNVEKFDGEYAFAWVQDIIQRLTPPEIIPIPIQPVLPPKKVIKPVHRKEAENEIEQYEPAQKVPPHLVRQEDMVRSTGAIRDEVMEQEKKRMKQKARMGSVETNPRKVRETRQHTPINEIEGEGPEEGDIDSGAEIDIPENGEMLGGAITEDEDEDEKNRLALDRHRNPTPRKSMRTGENSYDTDENLYQGEAVDSRKGPRKSVKDRPAKTKTNENISMKAANLEKERKAIESQMAQQKDRPKEARRQ
jgi:hypothetical protein